MLKFINIWDNWPGRFVASAALLFLSSLLAVFIFDNYYILGLPFAFVSIVLLLQDMRIAFYAMLFLIPFSFNIGNTLDFPDEILQLILTAYFILFALQNRFTVNWKKLLTQPIIVVVLISFFWLILATWFSADPLFSLKYLVKKIWYLVPFLFFPVFILRSSKQIILAYQMLAVPLFILGIWISYRYSLVGFKFEAVHAPLQPFFQNHVIYGSVMSCMIPLSLGAIFLSRKLSIQWLLAICMLAVFLFATYFAYSRAAWVAVFFAMCIAIAIKFKKTLITIIGFYILVLAGVLWMANKNHYMSFTPKMDKTIMHETLEDHIVATIQGTDISSAERYYRWIAAIRMSTDRPLLGVGPNNWYSYYKPYTISSFRTWVSRNMEKSTTHNYFLFMLVEQGYPAMILYAILIVAIFYQAQKIYHRTNDRFYKISVLSVTGMLAALFINNFFSELLETDKMGSMFYIGIAILVVLSAKTNNQTYIKQTTPIQ